MRNTGYLSYMIVLKMLGVKSNNVQLEELFMNTDDIDLEIISNQQRNWD